MSWRWQLRRRVALVRMAAGAVSAPWTIGGGVWRFWCTASVHEILGGGGWRFWCTASVHEILGGGGWRFWCAASVHEILACPA